MKKKTDRAFISAFVATVALTTFFLVTASRAVAQNETPQFKVGDRVEIDTMFSQHPEQSTSWRKGTIVRLYDPEDTRFGGFIIKMDDGREWRHRFIDTQWIRPPQGTDAPAADKNKTGDQAEPNQTKAGTPVTNINEAGTQTANQNTADTPQTGAVSCAASDDLSGTSQAAVFKRLIAAQYEKDGKSLDEKNKSVSVTIPFDVFKTGATHPYHHMIHNPDGPDGVDGGTVFAVKATYLVCEDYPGYAPTGNKGEIQKREYENMTYSCFKDAT